jgi:hypothetical protein
MKIAQAGPRHLVVVASDEGSKVCSWCVEEKPLEEFYRSNTKDGRDSYCKNCRKDRSAERYVERRDERANQMKKWREENAAEISERRFWANRLRRYGISREQYEEMVKRQNGLCAICKLPPRGKRKVLDVDHNHETGQVRELLCSPCNSALGKFRDDPLLLAEAIEYLKRWS